MYASFSLCAHPEPCHPRSCPPRSSGQRRGRASLGTAQIGTKTRSPCAREGSALPPSHNCLLSFLSPGRSPRAAPVPWHRGHRPARGCRHCALESGDGAWHLPRHLQPCSPVPCQGGSPVRLALTCCPTRVPGRDEESFGGCPGWQSPRPGATQQ